MIKKTNSVNKMMYNENILHELATVRRPLGAALKQFCNNSYAELLNLESDEGETPLDVAIDYSNWNMVRFFINFNMNNHTVVTAVGELLARYWHIGSVYHDEFILRLIIKKKQLNKQECSYLLKRAIEGSAWPYIIPLLRGCDLSIKDFEKYFHWQIAEKPHLSMLLSLKISAECRQNILSDSIFICCQDGLTIKLQDDSRLLESKLLSFIFQKRKIIARRMKKDIFRDCINYKMIRKVMRMYC